MKTMSRTTWDQLITMAPSLIDIESDIRKEKGKPGYCANSAWYGYRTEGYKGRMEALVGFGAKDARVRTSQAYDVAYHHLYDQLPDCRHEGPCW